MTREGQWSAAVQSYGEEAHRADDSAAAFFKIRPDVARTIHVVVPRVCRKRPRPGTTRHFSSFLREPFVEVHNGIRTLTPLKILVDLAVDLKPRPLEKAVIEADVGGLIDPETLEAALADPQVKGLPGVAKLRADLERHTCKVTNFDPEGAFRAICRDLHLEPNQEIVAHGLIPFRCTRWQLRNAPTAIAARLLRTIDKVRRRRVAGPEPIGMLRSGPVPLAVPSQDDTGL